jgi:hypothetical protein
MNKRGSSSMGVKVELLERRDFFSVSTDGALTAPEMDGAEAMLLPAVQLSRETSNKCEAPEGSTEQARQVSLVVEM